MHIIKNKFLKENGNLNLLNSRTKDVFVCEIKKQCEFAFIAYDEFQKILKNHNLSKNKEPPFLECWFYLQAFLIADANISKIFAPNPNKPQYAQRGKELLELIPLGHEFNSGSRQLRNKFEHFDEYAEDMLQDSRIPFIDSNWGDKDGFLNTDSSMYMRHFNPATREITFLNQSFKFEDRLNVIKKLYEQVKKIS